MGRYNDGVGLKNETTCDIKLLSDAGQIHNSDNKVDQCFVGKFIDRFQIVRHFCIVEEVEISVG